MARRPLRALALVATTWWIVARSAAAAMTVEDEPYDGRSTDDTVSLVVGGLVAIAVATALLAIVYVWHTSPRRRLRVATRRAAQVASSDE